MDHKLIGQIFYTGVIGVILGIGVRTFYVLDHFVVLLFILLSLAMAVCYRRASVAGPAPELLLISVALLALALGILRYDVAARAESNPALEAELGQSIMIAGVVVREPDIRQYNTQLYVETSEGLLLVLTDRYVNVKYGDVVTVSGSLKEPKAFTTDLGRTFDYPGYLKARGVHYMVRYATVTVTDTDKANPLIAALLRAKHRFMRGVESVIPEPAAGLGEGVLLGVKRALGEDFEENFRRTGIIHIVVLSGYNVMIVAEAIMRLLAIFFSLRTRVVIGIAAISGFALMVGLGATVVRASIMAGLVLIARATGRSYAMVRALLLAGLAMLIINPYLLVYDPGFQLSFLATLALVIVAPTVERWLGFVPSVLQIREFLVATISTQIFVLPLLLFSIGSFSVVAVLVNVLVLPMVPVAMGLTLIAGLLALLYQPVATPVAFIAFLSLSYIIILAEFFGELSIAAFAVPSFPFWVVIVAYMVMGFGLWRLYQPLESELNLEQVTKTESEDFSDWKIEVETIKSGT